MNRKVRALRALAERPGTEAEGKLAREMLERIQSKFPPLRDEWEHFGEYLRSRNLDDLAKATGYKTCPCGNRHPSYFTHCPLTNVHARIVQEMHERFQRGARVFYNRWAYSANCAASVVGYSPSNWNWIRLKFDHLKNSRAVPIYEAGRWHLSTQPIDTESLRQSGLRGGMEACDNPEVPHA